MKHMIAPDPPPLSLIPPLPPLPPLPPPGIVLLMKSELTYTKYPKSHMLTYYARHTGSGRSKREVRGGKWGVYG